MIATRGASTATRDSYARDLSDFFTYATSKRFSMESLGHAEISDYLADLTARHMAPSTLARRRSCLTQWFKFLISERILTENPVLLVRAPKRARSLPKTGILGQVIAGRLPRPHLHWQDAQAFLKEKLSTK